MYKFLLGSLIGLLGGIVGSMFGMSGAFIIIPLLLLFGVCSNQLSAQGTTLCMLLPPISIFAAYTYYKNKHVDFKLALILIIFYIFGTLIGSKAAVSFSEKKSRINFAILLLFLSGYVFYTALNLKDKPLKI
tara:strand:+ start:352 stop:747 length:396 start_codon:yes stop_codon:yes gene_type:complete